MKLFNFFNIWLLSLFIGQTSGISYNQPKLCANASWNSTAITLATSATVGALPIGIFVSSNNTVYVADQTNNRIQVWLNGNTTPSRTISGGLIKPTNLFVTDNGDIYVENAYSNMRVDKWGTNSNSSVPAMYVCLQCSGVFVDINNMLYCSMYSSHKIVSQSLDKSLNIWAIVAGTGTAGATSLTLTNPRSIFVDTNLNLYVADGGNNRIQKFLSGQLNGTTISTGTITLYQPTAVVLDADGYLFIADCNNHRLIGSGPYGFRCIAACSGSGSQSNQLNYPIQLSFDSYGNIFVTDYSNNRIQKFLLSSNVCNTTTTTTNATTMMSIVQTTTTSTSVSYSNVISFNQPKFGAYAAWDNVGITFANSSTVGTSPYGIFVDTNNTVYVANKASNQIQVWLAGSSITTRNITSGVTSPYSIFATITGDIYVDNGYTNNRVDKWVSNRNISSSVMQVQGACYDLFIDVNNTLYCSLYTQNQVAVKSLNGNSSMWIVAAGMECSGSTSNTLSNPRGIFVDTNLNLYVADCGNDRVQLFLSGQVTATTVAGSTAAGTISLDCPSDVALDKDGYLFIVDSNNNRIIGSGPNGFRCIIACASTSGPASTQLSSPSTFSFDSYGNIYVTDQGSNNRVQKFMSIPNTTYPLSFNQPNFCPSTTWYTDAVSFASSNIAGSGIYGIFVSINNTVYIANRPNSAIYVFLEGSTIPNRNITVGLNGPMDVYATLYGDVYIDNGLSNGRVDKLAVNANSSVNVMTVTDPCEGFFIDISNTLYCSITLNHKVVKKWLNDNGTTFTLIAGTGSPGSAANQLYLPSGLFVDVQFNVYVTDCINNRVQMFAPGQLIGITKAGNGATGTITLNCPHAITFDANSYMFLIDTNNNRVVGSGPYGFRCLFGCTTTAGSLSNQLNFPLTFGFDSYGNLFVSDSNNNRVQKFIIASNSCTLSFNQPNFCPSTTWYIDAVTFASSNIAGSNIYGIFVSINNTVYVANRAINAIYVFLEGSTIPNRNITSGVNDPMDIYASLYGDVYIDSGVNNGRVDKWAVNANSSVNVMTVSTGCEGFFIDISNTLYCSITLNHQVVKKWLNDNGTTVTVVAGTGSAGSAATQLYYPSGLYVDAQYNLYVTDCGNNRIQFFPAGQIVGITKVGNGATGTITLNCPHAITFDANNYMFILTSGDNRIIGSGPYGFRCLFGCTTTAGSSSNQLNLPRTFGFDSYGNLFVSDQNNNRVQKFIIASNSCSLSYNQPTFCSSALWSVNAVTLASSSIVGLLPYGIFIDGINTVYVPNRVSNTILSWPQWSTTYTSNSYSNLSNPYSLFMSITGDIYIDNGYSYGRVDKYIFNTSNHVTVMNVNGSCYGLFIDISNNLYCSLKNLHQVVKLLLNNGTTIPTIAAGNGSAGSLSNMLNSPQGIYVDSNLNLYIADCANNRIQFIQSGQLNGVTIAGNGSSTNFILNYPTGIVLDANGYLFIVDSYNHRIVASSSTGFRCILGCSGGGSSASQLSFPQSMAFDSYGNIYLTDRNNSRVQQFALQNNSCLLQPPLRLQAVAVLQVLLPPQPVPQVGVLQAVAVLRVPLPLPPVPQVPLLLLLPPLVLQRVAAVPQVVLPRAVVVPQVPLLRRPLLAAPLRAVAVPQVVVQRVAAVPQAAPLPPAVPQVALPPQPAVLQQVAVVPPVVLLRVAVAPQAPLLPRPPLAVLLLLPPLVLLQAVVVPQVVLLLPPPLQVLQQVAAVPQVVLLLPLPVPVLQVAPLAVLLRAVAAPQVAVVLHLSSCSSLLATAQMLFEMTLMKFDASQIVGADAFLGPLCFTLFMLLVVFVCLSMFFSIIIDSFHHAKDNQKEDQIMLSFMVKKFLRWTGLKRLNQEEIQEERDCRMRSQYVNPIETFSDRIDQLLEAVDKIYIDQKIELSKLDKAGL
ncbi:unnamed protein product [Adineta steineri]|uniref:Polycystin cation channel PKD1/PKD2 domain-containing protein n=1 Tax=Adineta steineri TaxID=433720 RepID=A0A814JT87_9BILA|nr:unnamed protein product [Adineta steineri]